MKKHILLASSLLLSSVVMTQTASAGVSGNIGVTSNYVWRGVTQTLDKAAVSGGLDFEAASGFYAGTWVSNIEDAYELDLYAGFGGEMNGFSYDVGAISYQYPTLDDHFNEVYLNGGFGPVSAGVAYTFSSEDDSSPAFSKGDLYYSLGASQDLANGVNVGLTLGRYDFDDPAGDDYNHYQVSVGKDDFTFAVDKTTGLAGNDDVTVSVAWSKSFDF